MKKAFVVAGIVAAFALVAFVANSAFAFGVPGVPKSVSDVADAPRDAAYDACKVWADSHRNNLDWNSSNIESQMKGKEFDNLTYEKDWRRGGSDWEKKNQSLQVRTMYNKFAELKVSCNKDKCSSINCYKK